MRPLLACLTMTLATAPAGRIAHAQLPAARPMGDPVAVADSVPRENGIRILSDGQIIVTDLRSGWLGVYDSTLRSRRTVTPGRVVSTSGPLARRGALLPYLGDSSLLLDGESQSFMLLDPEGASVRVMAVPRMADMTFLSSTLYRPGVDAKGNLVYRAMLRPAMSRAGTIYADSAPIVRTNFDTRRSDTVAYLKIRTTRQPVTTEEADGTRVLTMTLTPFEAVDDWALMPDGTIAIVRHRDYHVDWIAPDGQRRSSSPVPWPWRRLSDDDKQRIVDGLHRTVRAVDSINEARSAATATAATAAAGAAGAAAGSGRGGATVVRAPIRMRQVPVSASEIADYPPAFADAASLADPDGRLWVREYLNLAEPDSAPRGTVYDVLDSAGRIVDRVSFPPNVSVVGFDQHGGVYGLSPRSATHMQLMRYRVAPRAPAPGKGP